MTRKLQQLNWSNKFTQEMEQIPGSKPKKLIRKRNLSNPSLISYNIKPLFDPQHVVGITQRQRVRQQPKQESPRIQRGYERHRSQISFAHDSLHEASQDFLRKKNTVPTANLINFIDRQNVQKAIESKLKLSGYQQVVKNTRVEDSGKFNIIRSDSIRAKQRHGYDIINGMIQK